MSTADNADTAAATNDVTAADGSQSATESVVQPAMRFTHLDSRGAARMVDVTAKKPTVRSATAKGEVTCSP